MVFRRSRSGHGLMLAALSVIVAGLAAGCLPALFKGHMVKAADGWSIEVRAVTDSLTHVQVSGYNTYAVAPDGYHWVWVFMNVRNMTAGPQTFGYESCQLQAHNAVVLPTFAGSVTSLFDPPNETFQPGEESYRRVIFAYPDGLSPRTFRCGNMFFEFPPPGGGS